MAKNPPPTTPEEKPAAAPTPEALLDAAEGFERAYAEEIATRRAAGLTREQAITVQRAQVREDIARKNQ